MSTCPENGWVVGNSGTILYSENGGETWETQQSSTSFDLTGIYFTDGHGWISGDNGTILHLNNGGIVATPRFRKRDTNLNVICYPNPVHKISGIRYSVPKTGHVLLSVVNLKGFEICTLVNNNQTSGEYMTSIDVSAIPAGIYLIRLQTNGLAETCKLIVTK